MAWRRECSVVLCFLIFYPAVYSAAGDAGVSVAYKANCIHASSPVWDAAMKCLHFVDIAGRRVLSYDPEKDSCKDVHIQKEVASVVPYVCNRVLVPSSDRILHVDFSHQGERLPVHMAWLPTSDDFCDSTKLNHEGDVALFNRAGFRFGAAHCDPAGRLWVGYHRADWQAHEEGTAEVGEEEEKVGGEGEEVGEGGKERTPGVLFSMDSPPQWVNENDPDGVLHQFGPNPYLKPRIMDLKSSDGLVWSKSGGLEASGEYDTLFRVDSPTSGIDRFEFNTERGEINEASKQRVVQCDTRLLHPWNKLY